MNDKTDGRSQMMYIIFIIEILIDALTRTHTIRRKKGEWGEEFGESMPHPETECMHSWIVCKNLLHQEASQKSIAST